jgi:hypothetical protein
MVDMDVNILAAWTVVLGFMGGVFHFAVLKPLNKAIENLDKAIGELRMDLLTAEDRRHELELKVVEIDQRARAAHHRIDRLEGRNTDDVEHR